MNATDSAFDIKVQGLSIEKVDEFTEQIQNGLGSMDDSKSTELEARLVKLFNNSITAMYKLFPEYKTNATLITDEVIEGVITQVGSTYSNEQISNKMYQPVSMVNHRLHRSMLSLGTDSTINGSIPESTKQELEQMAEDKFRDIYLEQLTEGFGDDLDTLRQEPDFDSKKLEFLIDGLNHTANLFSKSDRQLWLSTMDQSNKET